MATTTTETKNGAQAATDQSARAGYQAFDAMSDYFLAAFDAGLKFQTRWIETAKVMLDESAGFQRANRKLAEEMLATTRRVQEQMVEATQTSVRAAGQMPWVPADKR